MYESELVQTSVKVAMFLKKQETKLQKKFSKEDCKKEKCFLGKWIRKRFK